MDEKRVEKSFGMRLRLLRMDRNMQQKDVAEMLGITPAAYGTYERGEREPNLTTLCKIADLFDVSIDYLLGRDTSDMSKIKLPSATEIKPEYVKLLVWLQKERIEPVIVMKIIELLRLWKYKDCSSED